MKLKAFSILELMVAILISGIVISTVYSVLLFSNKQFFKFTAIKTHIRDYYELSSTLERDFETAQKVNKLNGEEIEIERIDQTIKYRFESNYILRSIDLHIDTFFFSTNDIELHTFQYPPNENLIESIHIKIQGTPLSFFKDYGAIVKLKE